MEFAELISTPKLDGVILHTTSNEPVDGTLCITGHHLILSSRREGVQELWVYCECFIFVLVCIPNFIVFKFVTTIFFFIFLSVTPSMYRFGRTKTNYAK